MSLLLLIYLLCVAVQVLCDSSTPLFIVPNWGNECLTSYLQLSNLIYDTRSTLGPASGLRPEPAVGKIEIGIYAEM